ncbi:MAG TPA: hypothetical protein DIC18_00630 [Clostridiales bacterium]|nr:hypothetical protein [Clostridiales bacterium]
MFHVEHRDKAHPTFHVEQRMRFFLLNISNHRKYRAFPQCFYAADLALIALLTVSIYPLLRLHWDCALCAF